ncbi:MAG: hypothetical protein HRT73_10160 [Flavobacteriales bacterium]|nr:hypothetical protein [Flavobacteriales bacterium]
MERNILLLFIFIITITANAQKDNDPQLKEIYFTNRAGEKITGKVKVADKWVYMVIESANAIGEKVVLKMDEDENYFYKRKFLGEGDSIKILIKKDIQKVKLVIYNANNKKHVKRRTGKKIRATKVEDAKLN